VADKAINLESERIAGYSVALTGGKTGYAQGVVILTSGGAVAGDANGLTVQSAPTASTWQYAAETGGITNTTTAVTIKAAAGAGVRNYLKSLNISHDTLGAATELAIRDGAGGAVLWRGKLQTPANPALGLTFDPPLKGTANTLMEVVTLTASVTGGVFVNATGYTGV